MGCVMCVCTFKWVAVQTADPYSRIVYPYMFMSLPSQKIRGLSIEKVIKSHNSQRLGDYLKHTSFLSELGCVMCVCTFKWVAVQTADPYSRIVYPYRFMSLPSQKNRGVSIEKLIKYHNSQRLGRGTGGAGHAGVAVGQ
jgi:hypothetical protein